MVCWRSLIFTEAIYVFCFSFCWRMRGRRESKKLYLFFFPLFFHAAIYIYPFLYSPFFLSFLLGISLDLFLTSIIIVMVSLYRPTYTPLHMLLTFTTVAWRLFVQPPGAEFGTGSARRGRMDVVRLRVRPKGGGNWEINAVLARWNGIPRKLHREIIILSSFLV